MAARYDDAWAEATAAYRDAHAKMQEAKKLMDVAKDELLSLTEENASGFGVSVKFSDRKGSVDYSAIVKSHLPELDVEQYRKAPSQVINIKVSEEI